LGRTPGQPLLFKLFESYGGPHAIAEPIGNGPHAPGEVHGIVEDSDFEDMVSVFIAQEMATDIAA
jgi:hypothetical protein